MKSHILAAAITFVAGQAATAGESCTRISDPGQRLECFDAAFAQSAPAGNRQGWRMRVDKSPLDDSDIVVVFKRSREVIAESDGKPEHGGVAFLCEEGQTSVSFYFAGLFLTKFDGGDQVAYRIDQLPAQHRAMVVSTDNQRIGVQSSDDAIALATELMAAEQLYVRATPMYESPVGMTFDLDGLEEALAPLRAACAW